MAQAIESTLAKIVAAGKTPGMPAGADGIGSLLARGVRYTYTHVPTLLQAGAQASFKAATKA